MSDGKRQLRSLPPELIAAAVNRTMLYLGFLTVVVVFLFASFQPRPVLLPTMSGLLTICACAAGAIALLRAQALNAPVFTYWDLAAVWLFVAIGLGMITDAEAVQTYLASLSAETSSEPQPSATSPSNGGL